MLIMFAKTKQYNTRQDYCFRGMTKLYAFFVATHNKFMQDRNHNNYVYTIR